MDPETEMEQSTTNDDEEVILGKRNGTDEYEPVKKRRKTERAKQSKPSDLLGSTGLLDAANQQAEGPVPAGKFMATSNRLYAARQHADAVLDGYGFNQTALIKGLRQIHGSTGCFMAQDGKFKVPGMTTTLPVYQVIGTGFMLERERCITPPYGGICADAMGLGKTVQMLAAVVNDWNERKEKQLPTLIVLKAHLLQQWQGEIEQHCEEGARGNVAIFRARAFADQIDPKNAIQKLNIVITSYNEVLSSHDTYLNPKLLKKSKSIPSKCYGILHKVTFHRIVLDEVQTIKTANSLTSSACRGLQGKHRWCLSATPISNRVVELWPLFQFLRVPHTDTKKDFKEAYQIEDRGVADQGPLQEQLQQLMIHRNHDTHIGGRKLLQIPPPHRLAIQPTFSKTEMTVYGHVERCMRAGLKKFMERPDSNEDKRMIMLKILLILRMMSTHVLMPYRTVQAYLDNRLVESIAKFSRDGDSREQMWISYIKQMFMEKNETKTKDPMLQTLVDRYRLSKKEQKSFKERNSWITQPNAPLESAKVKAVKNQVKELLEKDSSAKILIFTLFIQGSRIISEVLTGAGISNYIYHGGQSSTNRLNIKHAFDNDENCHVLIATMQSMGTGLNCQKCSATILVDRWWNSTIEEQAIGRAYRMGQQKSVQIRDLTVKGSFDEKIVAMQSIKRDKIQTAFGKGRQSSKPWTNDDYMGLIGGSAGIEEDIGSDQAERYADLLANIGKDEIGEDIDHDSGLSDMSSTRGDHSEMKDLGDILKSAAGMAEDATSKPEDGETDELMKAYMDGTQVGNGPNLGDKHDGFAGEASAIGKIEEITPEAVD